MIRIYNMTLFFVHQIYANVRRESIKNKQVDHNLFLADRFHGTLPLKCRQLAYELAA